MNDQTPRTVYLFDQGMSSIAGIQQNVFDEEDIKIVEKIVTKVDKSV